MSSKGNVFLWTPSFSQSGTYTITFRVGDGFYADSEIVIIRVNDVLEEAVNIEVVEKTGGCENGVCNFVLTARGDSAGSGRLRINFENTDYDSRVFNALFLEENVATTLTGYGVKEITGNMVVSSTPHEDQPTTPAQQSRFECGLQLNPGFCCPEGYTTSSDGSRCVLVAVEISY